MLLSELERVVTSMTVFKKYHPNPMVYTVDTVSTQIRLQEIEFSEITEEDQTYLLSMGWKTNGAMLWTY